MSIYVKYVSTVMVNNSIINKKKTKKKQTTTYDVGNPGFD